MSEKATPFTYVLMLRETIWIVKQLNSFDLCKRVSNIMPLSRKKLWKGGGEIKAKGATLRNGQ